MSLHFESERVHKIIARFRDLAEKSDDSELAENANELLSLYEDMVQPRDKAEIKISGALDSLLQHEIKKREFLARGHDVRDPLVKHWSDEIQDRKDDIKELNQNKKFNSGIFFTGQQLDDLSKDSIDSARRTALRKLSRIMNQEIKDCADPQVKAAVSAKDLGITF